MFNFKTLHIKLQNSVQIIEYHMQYIYQLLGYTGHTINLFLCEHLVQS
jgi:hypothetical protein